MNKTSDCHLNIKKSLVTIPPDFKEVPENIFSLSFEEQKELNKIICEQNSNNQFKIKSETTGSSNSFQSKVCEITNALDQIQYHPILNPLEFELFSFQDLTINSETIPIDIIQKFKYYNLENIVYEDDKTVKMALEFLENIDEKIETEPINDNFKPIFDKNISHNKIKEEKIVEEIKNKFSLLSFSDEL